MMSSAGFQSAPTGTRAITIPLTSSHRQNNQSAGGRAGQSRRTSKFDGADPDAGHASSSSTDSDWPSSSSNTPGSIHQSRVGLHASITSPSAATRTPEVAHPPRQHQRKDKQRATSDELPPNALPNLFTSSPSPLGPSMLSSSAYKSVNLNAHHGSDSTEPARLITYTKHSQGFTWNDELFLPSYLLGRHRYRGHGGSGSRRHWAGNEEEDASGDFDEEGETCPVTDIFVTDEEAAAMMP